MFVCVIFIYFLLFHNSIDSCSHIAEHLKDVVNKPVEQMTEEEMEFHYFKLHDYDNNNKLDGTEITKALTHFERGNKNCLIVQFQCKVEIIGYPLDRA